MVSGFMRMEPWLMSVVAMLYSATWSANLWILMGAGTKTGLIVL